MKWWHAAAMLVCLVVGYLVGSMDSAPGAGRAQRTDRASEPAVQAAPPERVPTAPMDAARAPSFSHLVVAAPDPAAPVEDDESEYGTLIVDFEGFDGPKYVRVEGVDLDGNYDYVEEGADEEGRSPIQLAPGEVTVRWEGRGALRRYAARARIVAGRVTLLRAADERHLPLPEPQDLAVLDVRLSGPDGRWLADATVNIGGNALAGTSWVTVYTDGEGLARFRVRSGNYEVQAGERSETVSLRAGERQTLELRHDAYGIVTVDPALEGTYELRAREGPNGSLGGAPEGHAVRFLFVRAGNYELWYRFSSREFAQYPPTGSDPGSAGPERCLLATFEVRSGREERIPHPPEPGFLEVEVAALELAAGRGWQMRVRRQEDDGNADVYPLEQQGNVLRGRTGQLARGAYRVEIVGDGKVVGDRRAVVGYGPTRIDAVARR